MTALDATHDPARRSWVASANAGGDFPIQNLPHGVFRTARRRPRGGVAIGDMILDMQVAVEAGLFAGVPAEAARAAAEPSLNRLMAMGNAAAVALRARLSDLLRDDHPDAARHAALASRILVPMAEAEMLLPAGIGAFTDFFTSEYHTARGARARNPHATELLPPAFKSLPIAYNSRASSVRISGEGIRRPNGQYPRADGTVQFGLCAAQDFELELGVFVGPGNAIGAPIPLRAAPEHLFGYCLVNDWSARDIQRWESTPLGPFLSKSLSTSISPWVVTAAALAPFACPGMPRGSDDPKLLHYLDHPADRAAGGFDIGLDAFIVTPAMRETGAAPARIVETNFRHMYWTMGQMLTHAASNGCNLQPGDLIASGTASGPTDESRACLSEITRGKDAITLPNGETRIWLEDGDEVIFRGRATKPGHIAIGFGECRGMILPAVTWPD